MRQALLKNKTQETLGQPLPMFAKRVVSQLFSCPLDFQHQSQAPAHTYQRSPGTMVVLLSRPQMKKKVSPSVSGEEVGLYCFLRRCFLTKCFSSLLALTAFHIIGLPRHGVVLQIFTFSLVSIILVLQSTSRGRISVQHPVTQHKYVLSML